MALNLQETQDLYQAVESGASISDYSESDLQFQLITQLIGYDTYWEVVATLKNSLNIELWDKPSMRFIMEKGKERLSALTRTKTEIMKGGSSLERLINEFLNQLKRVIGDEDWVCTYFEF